MKIFTDEILKTIKTKSSTDARICSWKGLTLMLALRCQELESALRSEIDEIKTRLGKTGS